MKTYNSGVMPDSNFTYEDFEGFLGTFYLTFDPLKNSSNTLDKDNYQNILDILDSFAEKYGVKNPKEASLENLTSSSIKSVEIIYGLLSAFNEDYSIGKDLETIDGKNLVKLKQEILRVFDRYGLANIIYSVEDNHFVPEEMTNWYSDRSKLTLDKILN